MIDHSVKCTIFGTDLPGRYSSETPWIRFTKSKLHMRYFILVLFSVALCNAQAQDLMAELQVGTANYNGDLTQKAFYLRQVRPSVGINIKYNTPYFFNFRAGLSYAKLTASDAHNKDEGLRSRNLNFSTDLIEFHAGAELNLMDPELFYGYPYIFAGLGLFYFNPYTRDANNKKHFLQPLGTEGQGLSIYPGRGRYSLIQFCLPMGGGWKMKLKNDMELCYEFGYRILFTDYLDDVSRTYPSLDALQRERGATAAELSYRKSIPFTEEGEARGNPKVKDLYFFNSIKLAIKLNRGGSIRNYRRHDG